MKKRKHFMIIVVVACLMIIKPINLHAEMAPLSTDNWMICEDSKQVSHQPYGLVTAHVSYAQNLTSGYSKTYWSVSFIKNPQYTFYNVYKRSITQIGNYRFTVVYRLIDSFGNTVGDFDIPNINLSDSCYTVRLPIGMEPWSLPFELE